MAMSDKRVYRKLGTCIICHEGRYIHARERCKACYSYLARTGQDRSPELIWRARDRRARLAAEASLGGAACQCGGLAVQQYTLRTYLGVRRGTDLTYIEDTYPLCAECYQIALELEAEAPDPAPHYTLSTYVTPGRYTHRAR